MSNVVSVENKPAGIPIKDRLAFSNSMWGMMMVIFLYNTSYLPLFLNGVVGISLPFIATVMGIAKILDIFEVLFLQPVLFEWAAKKSRWGRYRTWFILGPIICLIGHMMLQSVVIAAAPAFLYAPLMIIGYVLVNGALNIQATSCDALNVLWLKDPVERYRIVGQRNLVTNIGGTLLGFAMLPIIWRVGGVQAINTAGITFLVVLFNALNLLCAIPMFMFTKKLNLDSGVKPASNTFKVALSSVKLIFTNRQVFGFWFASSLGQGGMSAWGQVFAFIFLFYFRSPETLSWYNGVFRFFPMIANLAVILLAKKLRPRYAFIFAHIWLVFNFLFIYFFARDPILAIAMICLTQIFSGLNIAGSPALYSDMTEYTRWKVGDNIADRVFTVRQSTAKTSTYIANFMLTGMVFIGFSAADPSTHTPEILQHLKMLACLMPAGLYLAGLVSFLLLFQLKPKQMDQVRKELAERDAAAAAAKAAATQGE